VRAPGKNTKCGFEATQRWQVTRCNLGRLRVEKKPRFVSASFRSRGAGHIRATQVSRMTTTRPQEPLGIYDESYVMVLQSNFSA